MSATVIDKQAEIARIALNVDNDKILTKLLNYAKKMIKKEEQKLPCQYTLDEVKAGIKQSIEDVEKGRVTSYESVLKRYSL